MRTMACTRTGLAAIVCLFTGLSGCTLKATLDSTSDTISNFFSSTSGRSWLTEDGLVRDEAKTEVFVVANRSNLQQDIARTDGEYLASFERLLAVPDDQRETFRRAALHHMGLLDHDGPLLVTFADVMTASAQQLRSDLRTPTR